MPRPASGNRSDPRPGLPVVDRLAPPPPPAALATLIEAVTAPGDIVVDLAGRGGWVARAAYARRRKAISLELSPLVRLAAEVVLRPPDLRHLDATVAAIGARSVGETSLRLAVADHFRTRCRRCGRLVVAEELLWRTTPEPHAEPTSAEAVDHPWRGALPIEVRYRCPACGPGAAARESARAPVDEADRRLAFSAAGPEAAAARSHLLARFAAGDDLVWPPAPRAPGAPPSLPAELLDLHSPRQLAALAAILEAIEGGLRAPAIDAALRFGLLAAVGQASRLLGEGGRVTAPRLSGGRLRLADEIWRERNPWLAFEAGIRYVRGVVQRLEAEDPGLPPARFGEDVRGLVDGPATVVLRLAAPDALPRLAAEVETLPSHGGRSSPIRLAVVTPPPSPSPERLLAAHQASGWILGREAVARLPLDAVATAAEGSTEWQLVALRRSLEGAAQLLGPESRAVVLLPSPGLEPLVGAAVAASRAGYRLGAVRRSPEPDPAWIVELDPPGRVRRSDSRLTGAVPRPGRPLDDGAPGVVPGAAEATAPTAPTEPMGRDERPFSSAEALRTVVDAAVGTLKALGEPADEGRLLGPLLVVLDRAGHLRRDVPAAEPGAAEPGAAPGPAVAPAGPATSPGPAKPEPSAGDPDQEPTWIRAPTPAGQRSASGAPPTSARGGGPGGMATEQGIGRRHGSTTRRAVRAIVDTLEAGMSGVGTRRLVAAGGELWLAEREDRAAAAEPLSDRIEWAVLTFLATAGPVEPDRVRTAIEERLGLDDPRDRALLGACLDSYAVPTADGRLAARETMLARTVEHTRILARLVELGHALGFAVWLPPRERSRRLGRASLEVLLGDRERRADLAGLLQVPSDALGGLDAVWYVRGRATFLFDVEWTAMLATTVLRRGPRLPTDERTVRFLVLAPERRGLARAKLERSAILRATLEADNWHILLWNQLDAFAALERPSLAALEPFLGLDPPIERLAGDQLALFEPNAAPERD